MVRSHCLRAASLCSVPFLAARLLLSHPHLLFLSQLDTFADIKEQTPSYVDHHDYFVERLSSLAWSNNQQQPEEWVEGRF